MKDSYDANEAADFLHVDRSSVLALLESGELVAAKIGSRYSILGADLYAYHAKVAQEQTARRREAAENNQRVRVPTEISKERARAGARRRTPPALPGLELKLA